MQCCRDNHICSQSANEWLPDQTVIKVPKYLYLRGWLALCLFCYYNRHLI